MKKLRILLAMMAMIGAVAFVSSCDSDDEPAQPTKTIKANPTSLTFGKEAGSQTISVTPTNLKNVQASSTDSWIEVKTSNRTITVTVTATDTERDGIVTISADDAADITVPVKQLNTVIASFDIDPTSGSFLAVGGDKTFTITSNITKADWTATIDGTGFSIKSESDDKIVVNATQNDGEERTGTLTITSEYFTAPVVVNLIQSGIAKVALDEAIGIYVTELSPVNTREIQLALRTADDKHYLVIRAFSTDKPYSTSYTPDLGEYTFNETGAVKTAFPGYISGSTIMPSFLQNPDGIHMVKGGTVNIAQSGSTYTLTLNINTTEANTSIDYEYEYTYTGAMAWVTDVVAVAEIDSWIGGTWAGTGIHEDGTTKSWNTPIARAANYNDRPGIKAEIFEAPTGGSIEMPLPMVWALFDTDESDIALLPEVVVYGSVTATIGGTQFTGRAVQRLGVSNYPTSNSFVTLTSEATYAYKNSANLASEDRILFTGSTMPYDFGSGEQNYDMRAMIVFEVPSNGKYAYKAHFTGMLKDIEFNKVSSRAAGYTPSYNKLLARALSPAPVVNKVYNTQTPEFNQPMKMEFVDSFVINE